MSVKAMHERRKAYQKTARQVSNPGQPSPVNRSMRRMARFGIEHRLSGERGRVVRRFENELGGFVDVVTASGNEYTWAVENTLSPEGL